MDTLPFAKLLSCLSSFLLSLCGVLMLYQHICTSQMWHSRGKKQESAITGEQNVIFPPEIRVPINDESLGGDKRCKLHVSGWDGDAERADLAPGKAPCKRKLERIFSAMPSSVCLCRMELLKLGSPLESPGEVLKLPN